MTTKQRPEVLKGETLKATTACGPLFVTLNEDEGKLCEVILELGKTGSCVKSLLRINSILLSIILQSDLDREEVIKVFKRHCEGIHCGNPFIFKKENYSSCVDYVAKEIIKRLEK